MKYCLGRGGIVTNPDLEREILHKFFSQYTRKVIGESEVLYSLDQLKGRFLSTSFSPKKEDPRHDDAMKDLEALFERFHRNGKFSFATIAMAVYGSL